MSENTVNVLGTIYHIWHQPMCNSVEDSRIDTDTKEIYIRCDDTKNRKNFKEIQKKRLRCEIIKAFMAESGIDNSESDWFAVQYPKIAIVFNELGIG
jgi:hypothetical protein